MQGNTTKRFASRKKKRQKNAFFNWTDTKIKPRQPLARSSPVATGEDLARCGMSNMVSSVALSFLKGYDYPFL